MPAAAVPSASPPVISDVFQSSVMSFSHAVGGNCSMRVWSEASLACFARVSAAAGFFIL